jgi:site-specific recombinase XerD
LNDPLIAEFRTHLEASRKAPGTISLRLRHLDELQRMHPDLARVQERDLEEFLGSRAHLAPETVKSYRSSLVGFYKWAKRRGHVETNPASDLEPVRVPPSTPRVADDADIEAALLTATSARDRALILLGREAWLRASEIASLTTSARNGTMLRVTGKGGRTRVVAISGRLLEVLLELEHEQGRGYYFPGRFKGHMDSTALYKIVRRLTGWNPHALRHRGASAGFAATHDLRSVQKGLGHASIATTERYVHTGLDELEAAFAGGSLDARGRVDVAV